MCEPPNEEEILIALKGLKGNKAGGKNGILPEMVKNLGSNQLDYILDLFHSVWKEESVPKEWRDAILVPIPKKGDLSICDNWQGISLLDTVGKLFAKVIQRRLQVIVEEVLPDSQCGFRSSRGCVDMIFCARQLVEKAREHNTQIFILFVDLRKAYDSVPRQALWLVLEKYSIPPVMVKLIQSLHEGMKAEVHVNGNITPEIEVRNGLRQGCTIAPTLFNLYFNLVVSCWRERCQSCGVNILYKCGGKLVGERTTRPSTLRVTELQFADDAAAVGTSREDIVRAAQVLDEVTTEWGLTVNVQKTKMMVAGVPRGSNASLQPISIRGENIEIVTEFKYLGAIIEECGGIKKELESRIAKASRTFGALRRPVFDDKDITLATKRLVYRSVVLGVLLYGAETWVIKRDTSKKLEAFHNRCLRSILGISSAQQQMGHITSVQVSRRFGMEESLDDMIAFRRLRWLGHIARMEEDRLPKKILFGWLPQKRPAHGTKMRWRDKVRKDLKKIDIDEGRWFKEAQERGSWRTKCSQGLEKCTRKRVEMDKAKQSTNVAALGITAATATGTGNCTNFHCDTCNRSFRRRQDLNRHKCVTTRPRGRVIKPSSC